MARRKSRRLHSTRIYFREKGIGPRRIYPHSVLTINYGSYLSHGATTVNLVAPDVPVEKIEVVAKAFTIAIAKSVGFSNKQASVLVTRVLHHLRIEKFETLRPEGEEHPEFYSADSELEDIPF